MAFTRSSMLFFFCLFFFTRTNDFAPLEWGRNLIFPKKSVMLYNYEMIFLYKSFFINYILSFSLVGLWTIRLSVHVRRHWVQFTLARRGYDNHNCHNKPQIGNGWSVNDVMPGIDGLKIWLFWKTRQLGFYCGPDQLGLGCGSVELVVYWGPVQLVVEWGPVELVVDLVHVDGQ